MRNITLKQWVLAVLFALMPWVADAAGLGRLAVLSALGQPLNAEIDLVSVEKDELATLAARLASPDAYKQANLQYSPALSGLRLSIEKRPNGQPYIKVASTRSVNEAFIDLLIELSWATGRIVREYTALIDPPGFAPAPVAPAPPVAVPETRPAPQPPAAVAAPAPERKAAAVPAVTPRAKDYGPIQRGETLSGIARSVKPEGVTLEQMLVGLYRSNPDAFINENMNLVKSGRILRIPQKDEVMALAQQDAVKEVRLQAADWNAYRRKLADAAAASQESRTAVSGKITAKVEDKAAAKETKDVVRLSKGEPPQGSVESGKMAGRLRALEEEAVAREKALKEANERIAQLEKTIKDMQRLMEIKSAGMAAAQQKAEGKAESPVSPPPPVAKPEAAPQPEPAKAAATPAAEVKKDEPAVVPLEKPAAEAKAEPPQPKTEPKVVAPPLLPEPDFIDTLLDEPLYLAAGGGVIVLGLAFLLARRRRAQAGTPSPEQVEPVSTPGKDVAGSPELAAVATAAGVAPAAASTTTAEEVDPLAEAEVYIAYGRDAQAEAILKEALAKNPNREDIQLKLLEIYAARQDKSAFNAGAGTLHKLTGGQGANWLKAAAMGYALDPGNPLYEAGKSAPTAKPLESSGAAATDLDFDLGLSAGGITATDITLDPLTRQQAQSDQAAAIEQGAVRAGIGETGKPDEAAGEPEKAETAPETPLMPDFTLDIPSSEAPAKTDIAVDAGLPADSNVIDFNIELPEVEAPRETAEAGRVEAVADVSGEKAPVPDFKIDIGDINLNLEDQPESAPVAEAEKDAHWYDVQTKFDLAKAYQEMGDKEGAREILREVIKEGDARQQADARSLLETLG